MSVINYNCIKFLKSAASIEQLPPDIGAEVAFGGRSNAGKSSALNAITNIHRLARTSKTPGRTQLINFFQLHPNQRLVDLPGYGYAKAALATKQQWEKLLTQYVEQRRSLKGIVLLMDVRHPLMPLDWQMIEWSTSFQLPIHILLTKSDKLKSGAAKNTLLTTINTLKPYENQISVQLFSSFHHAGIDTVKQKLDEWLQHSEKRLDEHA